MYSCKLYNLLLITMEKDFSGYREVLGYREAIGYRCGSDQIRRT